MAARPLYDRRVTDVTTQVGGLLAGAALAAGNVRLTASQPSGRRTVLWAAGLVVAAAVYPAARGRWEADAAAARELLGLAVYSSVAFTAVRHAPPAGARIAAAGWASHAAFDLVHRHSEGSRLPEWYPAVCAGYDLVVAASLARG
jgi:hypothetical protein